jgi:peptidoglycan/LPS O-acetylase OafA/YrhL
MRIPITARAPLIDLCKVVAIQLIVWHHLAFYGPMSDVVYPLAPGLFDWLYDRGRLAVQVFLVIGGYLAAQSLSRRLGDSRWQAPTLQPLRLIWQRFLRLAKPYWVALGLALLSAALARELMDHAATPAVPTWGQLAAHALMLHDLLDHEGLSAGVWYVAIDFQLYILFIALASLSLGLARHTGWRVRTWLALLCLGLTTLSLYAFNLEPGFDKWGLYFFGAYGLGALAFGIGQRRHKSLWLLGLSLLLVGALVMAWRDRLVLAGITAVVLACWGRLSELPALPRRLQGRVLPYLAERSYALFLIHYPVCLAVNAVVTWAWPNSLVCNALGLFAGWLLSIGAAEGLYRCCEAPKATRLRPWPSQLPWLSLGRSTQRG